MPRLTKSEIERKILTGESVEWTDAAKKRVTPQLSDTRQRQLFQFLLQTDVREPTGLSDAFVGGLEAAFASNEDPASKQHVSPDASSSPSPWRLTSIEAQGFGGLNSWGGSQFTMKLDGESYLLEGPNGSGKSALVGAILWALTGDRPRDQSDSNGQEAEPVFRDDGNVAGEWPPIACYPTRLSDLSKPPEVWVRLTFQSPTGTSGTIERHLRNGEVTGHETFTIPAVLLEAGLLMPARLSQLRLDESGGRLTDAVQQLTGLDDLIAIGSLAEGLCHKPREYRAYRSKELAGLQREFDGALARARTELAHTEITIPQFGVEATDDNNGGMALLGRTLTDLAAELAKTISNEIKTGIDLAQIKVQNEVIAAIAAARAHVSKGLEGLEAWQTLTTIAEQIDESTAASLATAAQLARTQLAKVQQLRDTTKHDTRLQLKALGAQWHARNRGGAVEDCPLCDQSLDTIPELARELEQLSQTGEEATRAYADNVNAILAALDSCIPTRLGRLGTEIINFEPKKELIKEIDQSFVTADRYANCLTGISASVKHALNAAPVASLPIPASLPAQLDPLLKRAEERLASVDRFLTLADWFRTYSADWRDWWGRLTIPDGNPAQDSKSGPESLLSHLNRLSNSLERSGPYRKGAEAMRDAWKAGQDASKIKKIVDRRNEIAEQLLPLKQLNSLCESVAREAIGDLSERIEGLLSGILVAEQLQYRTTSLKRKEGIVVHAGFASDIRIDATLVANTSWLRAVLWAFVFAVREEAVAQLGGDVLPLIVLDDPQSTFDAYHRSRWAQYIATLQNGPSKVQVVLTTHDESFLDLIKVDGVFGRQALIVAPGQSCDHVSILEGAALERIWATTLIENTPAAAIAYLSKLRIYLEGLLKLMLRAEDASIRRMVLGDLRDLLDRLAKSHKAPWDHLAFAPLIAHIRKSVKEIAYIEASHHTTGLGLGMQEARDTHAFWRNKLGPALDRGFRVAREHRLLHGGKEVLYALPPSAEFPTGHRDAVKAISLSVIGKAAALSDGRAADGAINIDRLSFSSGTGIAMGNHSAYRLVAKTLEPVAKPGDILIAKNFGDVSSKSLVVALADNKALARRFEITENHSDVIALTAQAINPREIAPPVVAARGSLRVQKVVGVIFSPREFAAPTDDNEICDCGGEAELSRIASSALGLVEVDGRSAEPIVLDQQHIIIRESVSPEEATKTLNGRPIIAEDSDGISTSRGCEQNLPITSFWKAWTAGETSRRSFLALLH